MDELVFCPHCFHRVPDDAEHCPDCGAAFGDEERRSFATRLIDALYHPLSEVRMRVIIALGWRRQRDAADALVACARRNPLDVTEGLRIVESLRQMFESEAGNPGLERLAARHPSAIIREAAAGALEEGDSLSC